MKQWLKDPAFAAEYHRAKAEADAKLRALRDRRTNKAHARSVRNQQGMKKKK